VAADPAGAERLAALDAPEGRRRRAAAARRWCAAREREDLERALEPFTEKLVPGRWRDVRRPSRKELKTTSALALPIEEGSAKVRTGPPIDDEEDYALDARAGVVPMRTQALEPVPDARLRAGIADPPYLRSLVS
jgi:hypothetical protein